MCEYLIARFPQFETEQKSCRQRLKVIEIAEARDTPDERWKSWNENLRDTALDWAIAIRENRAGARKLFKIYAEKVKRP